jgi:hypothetical protein
MKRASSLIAALVVAGSAAAGDWKPVKIGGGGFLTGIDLSPDGTTRCVRADTYGAYCLDAAGERWTQVVTARSMPATDVAPGVGQGVYELRIAPSDPSVCTWPTAETSSDPSTEASGGHVRSLARGDGCERRVSTSGEKLAVDPINPEVAVLGTQKDGLWLTTDGGKTWRRDPTLPSANEHRHRLRRVERQHERANERRLRRQRERRSPPRATRARASSRSPRP